MTPESVEEILLQMKITRSDAVEDIYLAGERPLISNEEISGLQFEDLVEELEEAEGIIFNI